MGVMGDTVWVTDLMTRRVTLFSRAGELLATVPMAMVPFEFGDPPIRLAASPATLRGDGTFEGSFMTIGSDSRPVRVPRLRFDARGEFVDTTGWHRFEIALPVMVRVGPQTSAASRPLPQTPLTTGVEGLRFTVDRRAARSAGLAELTLIATGDDDADTLFVRTYPYRPIPLPAARADSLREAVVASLLGQGLPEAEVRRTVAAEIELPSFLPPVTRALTGRDTTLWLLREEDPSRGARWNVLDAAGEPLATVTTPGSFRLLVADAHRLWGVDVDELGVPWLVGYRIVRGG
jgi:hypothetical protein